MQITRQYRLSRHNSGCRGQMYYLLSRKFSFAEYPCLMINDVSYSNMSALDDFNTKHIGRFRDPADSEDSPRGVMFPVLGYFRTQTDISEWCSSIASKYQRVDFLINYADSEVVESISSEAANEDLIKNEPILSGAYEHKLPCRQIYIFTDGCICADVQL